MLHEIWGLAMPLIESLLNYRLDFLALCYDENNSTESPSTSKGFEMFGNWRYMVSAILFLGSGCLFLFMFPRWGISPAYTVSLPIFAVGLILVVYEIWRIK
jgi:hypothetical protein